MASLRHEPGRLGNRIASAPLIWTHRPREWHRTVPRRLHPGAARSAAEPSPRISDCAPWRWGGAHRWPSPRRPRATRARI
jgi:hypothetical protein